MRFVVQRHAATRLHFDLRLEMDGVFKSWAVTKVPSLDPAVKRLAVEVEDHPLDYGSFEGTIPKGEYGGGTVQLWDRGQWQSQHSGPVIGDLKKGHLKFILKGQRLKGGWALIRLRDKEKQRVKKPRHNWLLIKENDQAAQPGAGDSLASEVTSVKTARRLEEIGQTSKTNVQNSMPRFVAPMLCRIRTTPPMGAQWGHEVKLDGYRMQARIEKGKVQLSTRTGLDWTERFGGIGPGFAKFPDAIIDGEIVVLDKSGISDFSLLQAALSNGRTSDFIFYAFDLLFLAGADLRALPLAQRKAQLETMMQRHAGRKSALRFVDHLPVGGAEILAAACQMNLEGVISKKLDAPYRSGRSHDWIKSKCRGGDEMVIGGWWGDDDRLRSLLVGTFRGDQLIYRGRVGSGFNVRNSAALLKKFKAYRQMCSPFAPHAELTEMKEVQWLRPDLVAEIDYATITASGLLRQASFKSLREDKPATDVRHVRKPAKKDSKTMLSHPEKILWPAAHGFAAVTKAELADYYAAAAPRLLPFVRGRPLSVMRAPDGVEGEHFFQRHGLKTIGEIAVAGSKQPFLTVRSAEDLVALAQVGVLELHPWGAQEKDAERPALLTFDLDPAEALDFQRVIEAARNVKEMLEHCGLVAFVKTTGGKGLHVVCPLKGAAAWDDAKSFAHDLCLYVERVEPAAFTTQMSKAKRKGKIFLDYLRNGRMATSVAPWSPRARAHAPLSVPLSWTQVKAGLKPQNLTLHKAAGLLRKADPWSDFFKQGGSLTLARKKLDRL